MADGKPIYDGYAPWESFSAEPVWAEGARIVHLVTEGDVMSYLQRKRPMAVGEDRDGPNGGYRHYQIAGASHVGTRGEAAKALTAFGTLDNLAAGQKVSAFPQGEVLTPAHIFLIDWVMKGRVPPKAARLALESGDIARDEHGIARGGVRSPYVDLPTVRYIASIPPQGTLYGLEEAFSGDRLRAMYGSRKAYLDKFNRQIDAMVKAGWLFADDARRLKQEEAARELF
jgi:hypothetical protein